ncbi:MAG: hydrolase 1, exosortase A system-associated, partial [Betaproteobacteria bacterium]
MNFAERATAFPCNGVPMVAIVSLPQQPLPRGVLVVVGGPQYRAGSHRQFTLLCRALAEQGIAAMRFDYRGMGDAGGEMRTFEDVCPDIRAAIDQFFLQVPELAEVAIWGLCDAASAALFYAHTDPRVSGVVLVNPWARTATGIAKTRLRHYYWSRVTDKEFWRKLAHGELAIAAAARSFADTIVEAAMPSGNSAPAEGRIAVSPPLDGTAAAPLPDRMAGGLSRFKGRVLLILSGKD